jgi:hypothetical protein
MARGGNKVATDGEQPPPWTRGFYWQDVVLAQVALAEQDLRHIRAQVHGHDGAPGTTVVDDINDVCHTLNQAR